jgi:glycosyltransferase involved in cell wall biosynthesis
MKLMCSGRLGERKGSGELIRAMGLLRDRDDWTLCMAGDGDVGRYTALADSLELGGRVEFPGWVDAADIQARLYETNIFILPSHAEGLPLSLLEAMANGCAIVTTPVGNVTDALTDGVNGLLVDPGEVESLAAAIERLLEDPGLRDGLGQSARSTWAAAYSHDRMALQLASIWAEAAKPA